MMMFKLNGISIELTDAVLTILKKYAQEKEKNENGGILLGGYIPLENKYIITIVSEPCVNDQKGEAFFVRNKENAQIIINQYWKDSEGRINYLGEWHTHCCDRPYPSCVDKELLRMVIRDHSNVWPEIFMLILGRNRIFYLCMASVESKGEIVAEIIAKEE